MTSEVTPPADPEPQEPRIEPRIEPRTEPTAGPTKPPKPKSRRSPKQKKKPRRAVARERRPGLLRRLFNTPLHDLVRGRVTGARDLRYQLQQSKLPQPLRTIVIDVVRRTRLWPNEDSN